MLSYYPRLHGHLPEHAYLTPAQDNWQLLEYVFLFTPHTGLRRLPRHLQFFFLHGHFPKHLVVTFSHFAIHEFLYILPSCPHTGRYTLAHVQRALGFLRGQLPER